MRSLPWRWAAPAALIIAGAIAVILVWAIRPAQVTLAMRPVRPLPMPACAAEAHSYGYSISAAWNLCGNGAGASWYQARLTNNGPYAFMSCAATGYDAQGKAVFTGPLPFEFAGTRGLFAPGHRSIAFFWYLPRRTAAPVTRYATACSARRYPWA